MVTVGLGEFGGHFRIECSHVEELPAFPQLRESFNLALRERFRASLEGNVEVETRAWKLFGLIPFLLLHRLAGTGSVGRTELAQRADDFARGLWTDLIRKACEMSSEIPFRFFWRELHKEVYKTARAHKDAAWLALSGASVGGLFFLFPTWVFPRW